MGAGALSTKHFQSTWKRTHPSGPPAKVSSSSFSVKNGQELCKAKLTRLGMNHTLANKSPPTMSLVRSSIVNQLNLCSNNISRRARDTEIMSSHCLQFECTPSWGWFVFLSWLALLWHKRILKNKFFSLLSQKKEQICGCFLSYHLETVNFCSILPRNTTWRIMESKLLLSSYSFSLERHPNSSSQGLF